VSGTYSSLANCRAAGNANESGGGWIGYSCSGSGSSWSLTGEISATSNYSCPSGGSPAGSICELTGTPVYTCPSGGSYTGGGECTIVDDYSATQTISSENYGYNCPIANSYLASATICDVSGGSGPNLRRASQQPSAQFLARSHSGSTEGTS
jgi:hypothetical protein